MKKYKIIKNTKPLLWHNDDTLIVFKKTCFFLFEPSSGKFDFIVKMPLKNLTKRCLMHFRFFRRIFRLEPSCFTQLGENEFLFCFYGAIYCLDLISKTIKCEIRFRNPLKRTLSICSCGKNVFFGEYWTGPNKFGDVKIYRRINDNWECFYTFKDNEIRHVHKLMILKNDLYCFTGDEISETKIIRFKNFHFDNPETIYSGSQIYRSCCAVAFNNLICYATDTPYEQNKLVYFNVINHKLTAICDLESSSIYSSSLNGSEFYFSTAVEPNLKKVGSENKRIRIQKDIGGIHSKSSFIYKVNLSDFSIQKILSLKKDKMPFVFGLGTFVPTVNSSSLYLAFYSSCLKKDGSTIIIPLTK